MLLLQNQNMKIKTIDGNLVEVKESEILFAQQIAESIIDDDLQTFFDGEDWWKAETPRPKFSHFRVDNYDSSIEIYLRDNPEFDNDKLMELLEKYGFTFGWINFDDKTEIHFNKRHNPIFCERKPRAHAYWNKEASEKKLRE